MARCRPTALPDDIWKLRASFTLDVYMHVLPGMGEQVAAAIESALGGGS